MSRPGLRLLVVAALYCSVQGLAQPTVAQFNPAVKKIVDEVSEERIGAIMKKLESFGTRYVGSEKDNPTHGIGGAQDWIQSELKSYSPRLEVTLQKFVVPKSQRLPTETELNNIVAVLPGTIDKDRFVIGSWVARLQSFTVEGIEANVERVWLARHDGVALLCQRLDERIVTKAESSAPLKCYSPFVSRLRAGGFPAQAVVAAADAFLGMAPPVVTAKTTWPEGAGRHDYVSAVRYGRDASGNRLDGVVTDAANPDGSRSTDFDRYRWQAMVDGVTALTLAVPITGDRRYSEHAVKFVRGWFLDEGTRMTPHSRFAQSVPQVSPLPNGAGIVDFRDIWALCDALRLLARDGTLSPAEVGALREWFRAFVTVLGESGGYLEEANNIALFHDVIAASAAAFCGSFRVTAAVLGRASLRIHRQVRPWGWQPGEADRAAPLHYALFGIQAQIALAWLARNCGIDLWAYAGRHHRSIPMAIRHVAQNRRMFADYDADRTKFDDRIEVALRAVPADAVDADALQDVPRRPLANPDALGAAEGLPPWWSRLLATDADARPAAAQPLLPFSGISVTYTRPGRPGDQSP